MDVWELYYEIVDYVGNNDKSLEDRAKALVNYYYNTEDRGDKDFDTLDLALDLLKELSER